MQAIGRRFTSVGLAIVLTTSPVVSAFAAVVTDSAPTNHITGTAPLAAPNFALGSQIPVTLYNSGDKNDTKLSKMDSGTVTPDRVPQWDGYSFVAAWLVDPQNTKNHIAISQLNFVQGSPGNGMPNGESYVIVKPVNTGQEYFNLCIPMSQTAQFIYLEYAKVGKIIDVSYSYFADKGIVVNGPSKIYLQSDDTARGYFTVSVPRVSEPLVIGPKDPNISVTKIADISKPDETVFRYELVAQKGFTKDQINLQVYTRPKGTLSISFKKLGEQQEKIWKSGNPAGKFANQPTPYSEPSRANFKYGESVTFNMYHDRVFDGFKGYSIILGSLYLNDHRLASPQPMARFGPIAYDLPNYFWMNGNNKIWLNGKTAGGLTPPWYAPGISNQWIAQQVRYCPYWVETYSNAMGWDPVNHQIANDDYIWGYRNWWVSQIATKVIGKTTESTIDSGPLAGAKVTIEVLDAIPLAMGRQLGEYPEGNPKDYSTMQTKVITSMMGGYGNTLRFAYKVTIDNIPASIEVDSEWISTKDGRVGVYENEGVEDVQVWASQIGGSLWQPKGGFDWRNIPNNNDEHYVSINALPGTQWDGRNQFSWNGNPSIKWRGNVKNGYYNPVAVSQSVTKLAGTKPLPPVKKVDSGGRHIEVELPVIAVGADTVSNDAGGSSAMFGGMSTMGVKAPLMRIPLYYNLDGGKTDDEQVFPVEGGSTKASIYDVESNPVVHVTSNMPARVEEGVKTYALYWKLLYRNSSNELVDTNKIFIPGSSFDIRDIEEIGTRLSKQNGNAVVKSFTLQAVYDNPRQNPLIYRSRYVLNGAQPSDKTTIPGRSFWAVKGIYAQPQPGAFPQKITYKNQTYYIDPIYNKYQMTLLGNQGTPPFIVPYNIPEAQRWEQAHSAQGKEATYEWGSRIDRAGLTRMIVDGDQLPLSVSISADPQVDTYKSTGSGKPQEIQLTLTFSDGSQLVIEDARARITTPIFTGITSQATPPLVMIGLVTLALGAGIAGFIASRHTRKNA